MSKHVHPDWAGSEALALLIKGILQEGAKLRVITGRWDNQDVLVSADGCILFQGKEFGFSISDTVQIIDDSGMTTIGAGIIDHANHSPEYAGSLVALSAESIVDDPHWVKSQ